MQPAGGGAPAPPVAQWAPAEPLPPPNALLSEAALLLALAAQQLPHAAAAQAMLAATEASAAALATQPGAAQQPALLVDSARRSLSAAARELPYAAGAQAMLRALEEAARCCEGGGPLAATPHFPSRDPSTCEPPLRGSSGTSLPPPLLQCGPPRLPPPATSADVALAALDCDDIDAVAAVLSRAVDISAGRAGGGGGAGGALSLDEVVGALSARSSSRSATPREATTHAAQGPSRGRRVPAPSPSALSVSDSESAAAPAPAPTGACPPAAGGRRRSAGTSSETSMPPMLPAPAADGSCRSSAGGGRGLTPAGLRRGGEEAERLLASLSGLVLRHKRLAEQPPGRVSHAALHDLQQDIVSLHRRLIVACRGQQRAPVAAGPSLPL
eukprot:TRINITY_DN11334_c0_g1_i1.p1 TRINITY_DN11334_c0_g1~~TRINITY_DN11334_c0_g1_i1.p1  ORF type:complete len:409 (+),score=72.47 TRINITY_DN11334_c0_g1_i1:73-1227(+)